MTHPKQSQGSGVEQRVTFTNRQKAEQWLASDGQVCVSIHSSSGEPARLRDGFRDVLVLEFDDLTDDELPTTLPNAKLFSREQGRALLDFMRQHEDAHWLIHCDAGVSRSAAVARFVAANLGVEAVGTEIRDTGLANGRVLRVLGRELFDWR